MAYKVKYRLDYCNKEKLNARLDFEIKDYTSTIIHNIVGTQNAFSYKVRNEKPDRSGYFRTLEADINIFEDENFNIDNLLTSDETAIRVKFYIENQLEFIGFIIPDFFEVSIDKPRVISMVASDRIGTLKNQTLPRQTGIQSFRYILEQSLLKTGLDLPLNSTINFNPIGETGDFLTNTGGLMDRLSSDKGASISCYDIIKSILIVSNSFLVQAKGQWHILNKIEYESKPKTIDIEQINVGGRRLISPPSSQIGVMAEFAGGKTYPINYNFEQYSGGKFTGWSSVDGERDHGVPVIFEVSQNNRELKGYSGNDPILENLNANISDLVNSNLFHIHLDERPAFLKSDDVSVISYSDNEVLISVELNLKGKNLTKQFFSVFASKEGEVNLTLSESKGFVKLSSGMPGSPGSIFLGGVIGDNELDPNSVVSKTFSYSGILKDENSDVRGWKIFIAIWGAGEAPTFIDSASFKFSSAQKEIPKGNIFKIRQGVNFTKENEIDTTIFGDFINKGVNGHFYDYQKDEKNSIFYKIGTKWEHLGLRWRSLNNPNPDTLLLHSVRQRAIMFSSPHNIITATIKGEFSALDIYDVCGIKYVLVEAEYDFYRNETELRIEEVKYDNSVLKTDFIYSYFGGEDTTSISGVSNVSSSSTGSTDPNSHSHLNKRVLDTITQEMLDNALREILGVESTEEVTDENFFSALRTLKEILDNNEVLKGLFLSKTNNDTAQGSIQFLKGISVEELATLTQGLEIGNYTSGLLGSGAALKMKDGLSELEVDKLTVRMIATFFEIVVSKLRHINGGLVLSQGAMTCSRVVEDTDSWQCFFERGENNEISNTFVVNDQARCQVFNAGNQKFYWRLVTAVGDDWIRLSKTVGIGDSIPTAGDDIVQLGYQGKDLNHVKRLNAQIIDESGISQYVEIDSFTLEGKRRNFISADGTGSQFTGKVSFVNAGTEYDLSDWAHQAEEKIEEISLKRSLRIEKWHTPGYDTYREGQQNYNHTLELKIFHDNEDVTDTINIAQFTWMRVSENILGDPTWNDLHANAGSSIDITIDDLAGDTSFIVQFYDVETQQRLTERF